MGGAFVAVADDASAAYWNPAGIATGATFDLQVSDRARLNDFRRGGPACPRRQLLQDSASRPVSLQFQAHLTDKTGDRERCRCVTLTTTNIGITVVQTIAPGLVIGTTARVVRGGIEAFDSRTTVDLDAGAMVSAWDMRFGLTARNLREPEFQADGEWSG